MAEKNDDDDDDDVFWAKRADLYSSALTNQAKSKVRGGTDMKDKVNEQPLVVTLVSPD